MKKLLAGLLLFFAFGAQAVTTVDLSHPLTTDNYTSLLPALVTENGAIMSFCRTDLYTCTNGPTGSLRLNTSNNEIEAWSGTAWGRYALNYLSLSAGGTVAGTVNFSGTLQSGGATVATQSYVTSALTSYAPLASPALTGTPTAPTAANGTNTTQLATTAYVVGYAPSTTGTNASGTWGIGISGNAATATSATSATSATTAAGLSGASPALGTNWNVDGNGQLTNNGATMYAAAYYNSAQFAGGGTVTFNTLIGQNGSNFSISAGVITIATAGIYEVDASGTTYATANYAQILYFTGTANTIIGPKSAATGLGVSIAGTNGAVYGHFSMHAWVRTTAANQTLSVYVNGYYVQPNSIIYIRRIG